MNIVHCVKIHITKIKYSKYKPLTGTWSSVHTVNNLLLMAWKIVQYVTTMNIAVIVRNT